MNNDDSLQEHARRVLNLYQNTSIHSENEYIRPEIDKQGNIYGYKVLVWRIDKEHFISPLYMTAWESNGELKSDKEPTEAGSHGIYFMKRVYDSELYEYVHLSENRYMQNYPRANDYHRVSIVQCVIFGVIVEGERGFRSEYAKITGVLRDGHWQTYQDFQKEAQYYGRRERTIYESRYDNYEKEGKTEFTWNYRDTD